MGRTQSKHGLERKYKSWRKGKGKTGGGGASLRNQLRSQTRFLQKTMAKAADGENDEMIEKIQARIKDLEKQIQLKEHAELERKYATK